MEKQGKHQSGAARIMYNMSEFMVLEKSRSVRTED